MDFPGGRVPFTSTIDFTGGQFAREPPMAAYRTLDGQGSAVEGAAVPHPLDRELALKVYRTMATLQVADTIFYEAQRQGRFSFYMTSTGEEATTVASAAALDPKDTIFTQYREQGVFMFRGFTLQQMADQCFGNNRDASKGRQMPVHYGSRELKMHTISSPLATQLPQAVGAAYALKLQGIKDAIVAVYFGEGAASEGDFHAALNFASTLSAPCLFICRNNGWAISTPATEQYRGDGIAARGPSYGIATLRVDGGDALAVYNATCEARNAILQSGRPVLLEAMSYRSGHHSTSDDSSRYRTASEMQAWRARDSVARFSRWLTTQGWWDEEQEKAIRVEVRKEVVKALESAEQAPKPQLSQMFEDVYDRMPWHLEQQQREVLEFAQQHPHLCPPGMPVS